MKRKIVYWGATGLVAIVALLGGFSYVTNSPEAIENFRHVGYPQQLRVLLGIAKLAGAIVLLLPRLPTLKEWAYAGFHLHVDRGNRRALSGGRREIVVAGRVARAAGGFVRDAPGESPRFREVDAGAGRRLDPASGVRAVRRLRPWRRRSSCPMSSRERRVVGNGRGPRERPERSASSGSPASRCDRRSWIVNARLVMEYPSPVPAAPVGLRTLRT